MLLRAATPRALVAIRALGATERANRRRFVLAKSAGAENDPERATSLDGSLARARRDASSNAAGDSRAPLEFDEKWRELDAKVNEYPCARKFQAIGVDDGRFVNDVRAIVSDALGGREVHPENVTQRASSKGKYVSANVTIEMQSGDEVIAVYTALKANKRVLWYL